MFYLYNDAVPNGAPVGSSGNYNYWTANGGNSDNPGTASLPLVDTPELSVKTQIFPAAGYRQRDTGTMGSIGSTGYYWSGTPAGANIDGYDLRVSSSYVNPAVLNTGYTVGFSIRCVRP